jgi:hypothetical protein
MYPMKTIFLTTLGAGLLAAAAFGIEAPPDNAPPPPQAGETPQPEAPVARPRAANPAPNAQTAYLGVVSTGIPEMLSAHLDLKPGEGIVVRAVMPDGPAAKAGLTVHDVIIRVAGQAVGSSEDLTKQVTTRQPGDTIRLDVIHKGKPAEIEVTLGSRPDQLAAPMLQPLDELNLDGIPRELADRVRGMIEGNLGDLPLDPENGMRHAAPQIEDAIREMRERMAKAMGDLKVPEAPQQGGIEVHQGATIRLMDEQGSIELKSNDGGKEITVRGKDDKIIWTGPWDTEQDKAAAPDEIRQRVERLDFDTGFERNGLRLRLRGGNPGPEQPE